MYFYAKANGQIFQTKSRIEGKITDWQAASDESLVVINCPDEEEAKALLDLFRKAMIERQMTEG